MAIHNDVNLSVNDARILSAIFDPEALPSSVAKSRNNSLIDSSLPHLPTFPNSTVQQLEKDELAIIHSIPEPPSETALSNAIERLDSLLNANPEYASAYVQRAMCRRLRLEARDSQKSLFEERNQGDLNAIFPDLTTAIRLASSSSSEASVSPFQARILKTAFSHRAYMYLKASDFLKSSSSSSSSSSTTSTPPSILRDNELRLPEPIRGKGKDDLEEMASRDFAAAAKYGDEVAREMSVRTNPYARMCGAIVRNAIREERGEVGR